MFVQPLHSTFSELLRVPSNTIIVSISAGSPVSAAIDCRVSHIFELNPRVGITNEKRVRMLLTSQFATRLPKSPTPASPSAIRYAARSREAAGEPNGRGRLQCGAQPATQAA